MRILYDSMSESVREESDPAPDERCGGLRDVAGLTRRRRRAPPDHAVEEKLQLALEPRLRRPRYGRDQRGAKSRIVAFQPRFDQRTAPGLRGGRQVRRRL